MVVFLAGAFFNSPDAYPNNVPVVSVLLLPEKDIYYARNQAREGPYKKGGDPVRWFKFFDEKQAVYPVVIRDDDTATPEITLTEICMAVADHLHKPRSAGQ
jgi:hypothetical protein